MQLCKQRLALFVDVETTGLDHQTNEIIELAIVTFTYGPDGHIYEVNEPFQRFHQPIYSCPLLRARKCEPPWIQIFGTQSGIIGCHKPPTNGHWHVTMRLLRGDACVQQFPKICT
jgi:hypothetical protein